MLSKETLALIIAVEDNDVANAIVSPVDNPSGVVPAPAEVAAVAAALPEQDVPVDIQMVVEDDNATQMLGQATADAVVCQERADELLDMQNALESYGRLIRQTGLDGVSEEGAAFMQVGIKLIQKSLGTNVKVSTESFDDIHPRSSRTKVTISSESIKELAGKAYDAFVAAIKRLVELLRQGWEQLFDFSINQEHKIDEYLDRVGKLKGSSVGEDITIKSPGMLFADGQEVFPESRALTGLAHFSLVSYPKAMVDYYGKVSKFIKDLDPEDLKEGEFKVNVDAIAKPLHDLAKDDTVKVLFNGNHQISISENELSFGISVVDGKSPPSEIVLPVMPPVKLRKILKELHLINNIVKDYNVSNDRVIKAAEKLVDVAVNLKAAGSLNSDILSLVKDSAPRNREIAKFISKVSVAYLAVLDKMITHHEKSK